VERHGWNLTATRTTERDLPSSVLCFQVRTWPKRAQNISVLSKPKHISRFCKERFRKFKERLKREREKRERERKRNRKREREREKEREIEREEGLREREREKERKYLLSFLSSLEEIKPM